MNEKLWMKNFNEVSEMTWDWMLWSSNSVEPLKMDLKKHAHELKWNFSEFATNEEWRGEGLAQVYELNASEDVYL